MKTSAIIIKKTSIGCTEFVVTAVTLVAINAIVILPVISLVSKVTK